MWITLFVKLLNLIYNIFTIALTGQSKKRTKPSLVCFLFNKKPPSPHAAFRLARRLHGTGKITSSRDCLKEQAYSPDHINLSLGGVYLIVFLTPE